MPARTTAGAAGPPLVLPLGPRIRARWGNNCHESRRTNGAPCLAMPRGGTLPPLVSVLRLQAGYLSNICVYLISLPLYIYIYTQRQRERERERERDTPIYLPIHLSIFLSLSLYIYIYICLSSCLIHSHSHSVQYYNFCPGATVQHTRAGASDCLPVDLSPASLARVSDICSV